MDIQKGSYVSSITVLSDDYYMKIFLNMLEKEHGVICEIMDKPAMEINGHLLKARSFRQELTNINYMDFMFPEKVITNEDKIDFTNSSDFIFVDKTPEFLTDALLELKKEILTKEYTLFGFHTMRLVVSESEGVVYCMYRYHAE
jgi:hypothetical protein